MADIQPQRFTLSFDLDTEAYLLTCKADNIEPTVNGWLDWCCEDVEACLDMRLLPNQRPWGIRSQLSPIPSPPPDADRSQFQDYPTHR
jgi:hypothetical protein